ncbi:MAG: hypothetical protein AMXMBFR84_49460 [Candidatus Hydrogenedentota bacterium]
MPITWTDTDTVHFMDNDFWYELFLKAKERYQVAQLDSGFIAIVEARWAAHVSDTPIGVTTLGLNGVKRMLDDIQTILKSCVDSGVFVDPDWTEYTGPGRAGGDLDLSQSFGLDEPINWHGFVTDMRTIIEALTHVQIELLPTRKPRTAGGIAGGTQAIDKHSSPDPANWTPDFDNTIVGASGAFDTFGSPVMQTGAVVADPGTPPLYGTAQWTHEYHTTYQRHTWAGAEYAATIDSAVLFLPDGVLGLTKTATYARNAGIGFSTTHPNAATILHALRVYISDPAHWTTADLIYPGGAYAPEELYEWLPSQIPDTEDLTAVEIALVNDLAELLIEWADGESVAAVTNEYPGAGYGADEAFEYDSGAAPGSWYKDSRVSMEYPAYWALRIRAVLTE